MSQFLKYALLVAYVEARFGQEQVPVAAIQALSDFGNPGDAGTLSGQVPGVLLAAASPCDKVCLRGSPHMYMPDKHALTLMT